MTSRATDEQLAAKLGERTRTRERERQEGVPDERKNSDHAEKGRSTPRSNGATNDRSTLR